MRWIVRTGRVACVVVLCAATATPAGIRDKSYEVGVYGGIEKGDPRTDVSTGGAFGFRAGYAFTKKIMAELAVDAFSSDRTLTVFLGDPAFPPKQIPVQANPTADFISYTLGLGANFLVDRDIKTKPYFNVNIGLITEDRGMSDFSFQFVPGDPNTIVGGVILASKDTSTILTVGAGARTFFTDTIGIRYEVKYIHHDSFGDNQDGLQASVGATFVIGGKK